MGHRLGIKALFRLNAIEADELDVGMLLEK
jgi:hypothetical protein